MNDNSEYKRLRLEIATKLLTGFISAIPNFDQLDREDCKIPKCLELAEELMKQNKEMK